MTNHETSEGLNQEALEAALVAAVEQPGAYNVPAGDWLSVSVDEARELGVLGPGERFHGLSDVRGDQLRDCYEAILRPVIVNAITAYLQALRSSTTDMGVKLLEWTQNWPNDPLSAFADAASINRLYTVEHDGPRFYATTRLSAYGESEEGIGNVDSFDDAKAACQAHYTARILSALVLPPAVAPVQSEPVAWQWSDFSGKWYTVDTARLHISEQEAIARTGAASHEGRIRPLYASPPSAQAIASDGWQPIETAPTDGSWFQGWRPALDVQDQIDTWHAAEQSNGMLYWQNAADSAIDEAPTYWRLLPAPPFPATTADEVKE